MKEKQKNKPNGGADKVHHASKIHWIREEGKGESSDDLFHQDAEIVAKVRALRSCQKEREREREKEKEKEKEKGGGGGKKPVIPSR